MHFSPILLPVNKPLGVLLEGFLAQWATQGYRFFLVPGSRVATSARYRLATNGASSPAVIQLTFHDIVDAHNFTQLNSIGRSDLSSEQHLTLGQPRQGKPAVLCPTLSARARLSYAKAEALCPR
jgi:hypothetical protein